MFVAAEGEVATLEEVKKVKEAEIEKYKKYLSKAKKIIESFGGTAKSAPEDALEVGSSTSTAWCTCMCVDNLISHPRIDGGTPHSSR